MIFLYNFRCRTRIAGGFMIRDYVANQSKDNNKSKPPSFSKENKRLTQIFILNYANNALTSSSALLRSEASGFQLHLISGSTTAKPYLVNSSRRTFVDSPDQP